MAYIAPNTTVKILRDVLLAPDYVNTIYFTSTSHQYAYFASKMKYEFTAQSYQRHGRNSIRLAMNEDYLFDCNYMMFQNTSFDNKWFYAFITDVEYVSNNVCEVFYEIDIMQTWFFECSLKPCMIERTHVPVAEDTIGANLTPEPVQLMEYTYSNKQEIEDLNSLWVVIQIVDYQVSQHHPVDVGSMYDGVYGGAKLWAHACMTTQDLTDIRTFLDDYTQKPEAVLGMYTVPHWALPNDGIEDDGWVVFGFSGRFQDKIAGQVTGSETFGSYMPRNKKLYTYPYNFCQIVTPDGETMTMRYEYAKNLTCMVQIACNVTTPIECVIHPTEYKGIERGGQLVPYPIVNEDKLVISNFPLCSWSNDYYSTWISQHAVPLLASTAMTMAGTIYAGMPNYTYALNEKGVEKQKKLKRKILDPTKRADQQYFDEIDLNERTGADLALGALPNAAACLQSMYNASIHADILRGNKDTGNVNVAQGYNRIWSHRTHIPEEQARMIDNYFDKYGYAIGEIKTPVQSVRPIFTYLKTNGCVIAGRCPASVIADLQQIYDRGITFWVNGDQVGDYSLVSQNR